MHLARLRLVAIARMAAGGGPIQTSLPLHAFGERGTLGEEPVAPDGSPCPDENAARL